MHSSDIYNILYAHFIPSAMSTSYKFKTFINLVIVKKKKNHCSECVKNSTVECLADHFHSVVING